MPDLSKATVYKIYEDMVIYKATLQKDNLISMLHTSEQGLLLDLSAVSEMDVSGLQILLLLEREAKKSQKIFEVVNPSQAVRDVLTICNIENQLSTCADLVH